MNWRDDFPHLETLGCVYLDSAATAQKPTTVLNTLLEFYEKQYGTVHRAVYSLAAHATARYSGARVTVQKFLNARSEEEIIFTKGTTESINLVADAFGSLLRPGDVILISEMEHHSNIVPWQLLAEKKGITLKAIPMSPTGELLLDDYRALLTSEVKLVAIAHISNVTGTINPIEEMIRMAHEQGAKVLIDGAQSAPHMPVDVQALDVDFFAFSGHKAFGPTGVGVLYGKSVLLKAMPPYQGGGDMIQTVTLEKTTFQDPPLRFEAGTPMIAEVIALGSALDYITQVGRDNIFAYEALLLAQATAEMQKVPGIRILGTAPHKGAILTFVAEGVHPLDLGAILDGKGFAIRTGHLCAQPALKKFGVASAARISFAPYNTSDEIEAFMAALQSALSLLR